MPKLSDFVPIGETKDILRRNYELQSTIFLAQDGRPEEDFAKAALQALDVLGSSAAS